MLWRYSLRWGLPHKPRPGPYACPNPACLTAPRRRGCRADPQRIRSCAVRAMRFQFDPYNEVEVMAMGKLLLLVPVLMSNSPTSTVIAPGFAARQHLT